MHTLFTFIYIRNIYVYIWNTHKAQRVNGNIRFLNSHDILVFYSTFHLSIFIALLGSSTYFAFIFTFEDVIIYLYLLYE